MIRLVTLNDAEQICNIYIFYVENTIISFEENPISVSDMEKRISDISSKFPYFVYEINNEVIAYAYAYKWKERLAYRYSAESSIYVKDGNQSKGIGKELYKILLQKLKGMNIHTVIAGISLPNELSMNFHERQGYKKVAHFSEVGFKFNKWIDVGYWELRL